MIKYWAITVVVLLSLLTASGLLLKKSYKDLGAERVKTTQALAEAEQATLLLISSRKANQAADKALAASKAQATKTKDYYNAKLSTAIHGPAATWAATPVPPSVLDSLSDNTSAPRGGS